MKSKFSLRSLVKLLREAPETPNEKEEKGEDSIDSQIDQLFSDFEKEGKNSQLEGLDFRRTIKRFLYEAEGDDKGDEDKSKDEDKPEDEEKAKDEEGEKPAKLTAEDIDIDSFADSVVRLVDNYDSLLEVRNTILRRAVNFLLKSYEPTVADAFKDSLEERHGLEVGKSKSMHDDDDFQPPAAERAGSSPGGGP